MKVVLRVAIGFEMEQEVDHPWPKVVLPVITPANTIFDLYFQLTGERDSQGRWVYALYASSAWQGDSADHPASPTHMTYLEIASQ